MTVQFVPPRLKIFPASCFVKKIFKCDSRASELHIGLSGGWRARRKRHTAYCLCEAMRWHTLYLDTHMQPTSLSWAFDLLHNMSRAFRGQIARHKQRKCNANKPFSRCSCALWSNTFSLFVCFFFFLFRGEKSQQDFGRWLIFKSEPSQSLRMNEDRSRWLIPAAEPLAFETKRFGANRDVELINGIRINDSFIHNKRRMNGWKAKEHKFTV